MTYPNDPNTYNLPLFVHKPKLKQVTLWLPIITPIIAPLIPIGIAYFTIKHPESAAIFKQIGLTDWLQKLPFMISGGVIAYIIKEGYVDGKKAEATGVQAAAVATNTPTVTTVESTVIPPSPPDNVSSTIITTTEIPAAPAVATEKTEGGN